MFYELDWGIYINLFRAGLIISSHGTYFQMHRHAFLYGALNALGKYKYSIQCMCKNLKAHPTAEKVLNHFPKHEQLGSPTLVPLAFDLVDDMGKSVKHYM